MGTPASRPSDDQPGAVSQPEGDGPVTLGDRTEPGGQGSPDTNQAKTEPMSPTPDHPEPLGAPELSSMNVGAADPQTPSPQALAPGAGPATALPERSAVDTGPDAGSAHQATGMQGTAPYGESVDTDVAAGAARMDPALPLPGGQGEGDTATAPAAGDGAAPGTSEEQGRVRGSRPPQR
jgi:hypothetical protein